MPLDKDVVDPIVRWDDRSRQNYFQPLQSAYADLFEVDAIWQDVEAEHFHGAPRWYSEVITLGG